ncbi:hypothetical protein BD770DRAFT_404227, partial [Pilaira anomala]
ITKLEKEINSLNEKFDHQNVLFKDLIRLLAPSFSSADNNINNELVEASTQARENGTANPLNPDLLGKRDIPKVLEEVTKAFDSTYPNSYPGPLLRLLGLINHFNKERDVTGLRIDDERNKQEYRILKTVARKIHDDMVDEIYKELKSKNKSVVLPVWSQIRYKLEKAAAQHGFPLSRCQDSWAARLLLSETHKHRSNRSRNEAAVNNKDTGSSGSSAFTDMQVNAEALREERPSSDFVNLNCGDDFYDMYDYDREFSTLSLFPLPLSPSFVPRSPSPPPRSPSPPPRSRVIQKKRVIARDDDSSNEVEDMVKPLPAKKKRATRTRQSKRQKK